MRRVRTLNSIFEPLDGWIVDVGEDEAVVDL
jgi:hypothetical protein